MATSPKNAQQVAANLVRACATYHSGDERRGCAETLLAVLDLYEAVGFGPELRKPIRKLLSALNDVENGRRNPLFEVTNVRPNGPKDRHDDLMAKGWAAGALELLYRNNKKKDKEVKLVDVAGTVRRAIDHWKIPLLENADAMTIVRWRNRIRERLSEGGDDVAVYKVVVQYGGDDVDNLLKIKPF